MKRFRSVLLKVILPLCVCTTLTGAAFYKTTLKNTDSTNPLVDLGVIISVGGSYLPGDFDSLTADETTADDTSTDSSDDTDANSKDSESTANTASTKPGTTQSQTNDEKDNAVIEVYGDKITYNGYEKDLDRILVYIDSCAKNKTHIEFHIQYADYRILNAIKTHLEENNITNYETDYSF